MWKVWLSQNTEGLSDDISRWYDWCSSHKHEQLGTNTPDTLIEEGAGDFGQASDLTVPMLVLVSTGASIENDCVNICLHWCLCWSVLDHVLVYSETMLKQNSMYWIHACCVLVSNRYIPVDHNTYHKTYHMLLQRKHISMYWGFNTMNIYANTHT